MASVVLGTCYTQLVKNLPCKHGNLSSTPRNHVSKKLEEVAGLVISPLGWQRQVDSRGLVSS